MSEQTTWQAETARTVARLNEMYRAARARRKSTTKES